MINRTRSYYYPQSQSTRLMQLAVSGEGETCAQPANSTIELQDIYDKLYNYEQAQAEGLIIKLPVQIGTKVYYLSKSCDGRDANGLLHATDLAIPCPYYNKEKGVCIKKEASVWDWTEDRDGNCEKDLAIIDANCLHRLYSRMTTFQFGMTDKVITKFTMPMVLGGLYVSEDDMRQGLALVEQDMNRLGYDNPNSYLKKKARYF